MSQNTYFYIMENPGCLQLNGEGCVDFLQRQTTNDIRNFQEGSVLHTVLTTANARIIDLLTLLPEWDHNSESHLDIMQIYLITLRSYSDNTFNYLQSRIFIMDKVSILDRSREYIQVEIFGNDLENVLNTLGFDSVPAPGQVVTINLEGKIIHAIGSADKIIVGCRLFFPVNLEEIVIKKVTASGAEELGLFEYNLFRLEAGFPIENMELTEEFTPLELGLEKYVSTSKGCYTGQEVIARQVNYDKVTKQLCGLKLNGTANIGDPVWSDGRKIGVVTSIGKSPRFGNIAKGVVKKPFNRSGTEVMAGIEYENSARAVCSNLPFSID
jgi:folate-binding protein YgfZ